MKRMFLCFLAGMATGVFGYWYFQQDTGRTQLDQARAQVASGVTNLTTRIGEFGENSAEAVKTEIERTGAAVREKAKAAGRSIADTAANARITTAVKARLIAEPGLPALHINVDTTDGLVTLSGKVDSPEQVAQAVKVARNTEGVQQVISTLQVTVK